MQTISMRGVFPPALLLFAHGHLAFAQERLPLKDAVEMAFSRNALLSAGEQRVRSAEGFKVQAGLAPNPRLSFQHENARAWQRPGPVYMQDTDTFLYASQTIEAGNKRRLRVETAAAAVRRVEAEQQMLRTHLASRVAGAYWAAVGAERIPDLLAEDERRLAELVRYTEARVKEGASAGTDLMRIRLEHQRVSILISNARQDAVRTRARLFQEIGVPVQPQTVLTEDLGTLKEISIPDIATILEQRWEIQIARRAVLQAEANIKLQHANARPDPDLVAGYKRTGGYDTLLFGVQINLSLRNRNQGLIQAAGADVNEARETLRAVTAQVQAEVDAALAEYKLKQDVVGKALPAMVENARESLRIVTLAWKEGGVDILRLMDAQRVHVEAELQYVRAQADYQQSALQLAIAVGVNP